MRGYGNQAPHPRPQNEGRGVFPALPQHGSPSLILGEGFGVGAKQRVSTKITTPRLDRSLLNVNRGRRNLLL